MAEAATFDALGTFDGLKSAGFSEPQARALTDSIRSAANVRSSDVATKADVANLKAELKDQIGGVEQRLLKAINDQQRWTIATVLVAAGLVFAALRLF